LSSDFPTSAKMIMQRYSYEFGKGLDGVMLFTPKLIEQVLHVTGPIAIPLYKQIVTEQNLEALLHYYQLGDGVYYEQILEHVSDAQLARKLFTQRVATALVSTVTHLPLDKLVALAGKTLSAMKSKDLEVYVNNAQAESLIGTYGSTVSMDRSNTRDGL